jgi:hypothetical protein
VDISVQAPISTFLLFTELISNLNLVTLHDLSVLSMHKRFYDSVKSLYRSQN